MEKVDKLIEEKGKTRLSKSRFDSTNFCGEEKQQNEKQTKFYLLINLTGKIK